MLILTSDAYEIKCDPDRELLEIKITAPQRCPNCGSLLSRYGRKIRQCIYTDGASAQLLIQRFRCPECGRYHDALPDFLIPFKRYVASCVESGVGDNADSPEADIDCDEATARRWKQWFQERREIFEEALKLAEQAMEVFIPFSVNPLDAPAPGWLSTLARYAANVITKGKWRRQLTLPKHASVSSLS